MKKRLLIALAVLSINATAVQAKGRVEKDPFKWKVGNTSFKLGGFVRATINNDFEGAVSNHDFIVSSISENQTWTDESRTWVDASATRLSLDVTHDFRGDNDLNFFIEGDFRGAGNVFRLRQAYVTYGGLIAGQTWSFMADISAAAPTVDIQAVNSRTFCRTQLFGYRHNFGEGFSAGISVETPTANLISTSNEIVSVHQNMPDVPFFAKYEGGLGHVKVAGVVRSLTYGVASTQERVSELGSGVHVSGILKAANFLTLYGQAIYGKGIDNYISDLAPMSRDLVQSQVNPAVADALKMGGASIGAKFTLSKKVYLGTSYSQAFINHDGGAAYPYKNLYKGEYCSLSAFWAPIKRLTFGAEVVHGVKNLNKEVKASRASLMVKYSL